MALATAAGHGPCRGDPHLRRAVAQARRGDRATAIAAAVAAVAAAAGPAAHAREWRDGLELLLAHHLHRGGRGRLHHHHLLLLLLLLLMLLLLLLLLLHVGWGLWGRSARRLLVPSKGVSVSGRVAMTRVIREHRPWSAVSSKVGPSVRGVSFTRRGFDVILLC